jgi:hypothetical protein
VDQQLSATIDIVEESLYSCVFVLRRLPDRERGSNSVCDEAVKQEIQRLLRLPALTELSLCKYDCRADPSLEGPKALIVGGDLKLYGGHSQT